MNMLEISKSTSSEIINTVAQQTAVPFICSLETLKGNFFQLWKYTNTKPTLTAKRLFKGKMAHALQLLR